MRKLSQPIYGKPLVLEFHLQFHAYGPVRECVRLAMVARNKIYQDRGAKVEGCSVLRC